MSEVCSYQKENARCSLVLWFHKSAERLIYFRFLYTSLFRQQQQKSTNPFINFARPPNSVVATTKPEKGDFIKLYGVAVGGALHTYFVYLSFGGI